MFSLTKEEKWIVVFLAASLIIGLGAGYFKKVIPGNPAYLTPKNTTAPRHEIININTAGFSDFIKLKGVGVKTAQDIIEYRELNGPFSYIEDIQKVKGIGPKKFSNIKNLISVK